MSGVPGTGSLSTPTFVVDTTAPTILPLAAIPKGETPVSTIDVTFSEPIQPATFTTANLALTFTPYSPYGCEHPPQQTLCRWIRTL